MSLLQRIDSEAARPTDQERIFAECRGVYQKTDHKHPEYVDSEKWCGDQRTKYAVLKVEATSFGLAVICVALALVLGSVMFPDQWSLIGL